MKFCFATCPGGHPARQTNHGHLLFDINDSEYAQRVEHNYMTLHFGTIRGRADHATAGSFNHILGSLTGNI